MQKVRTQKGITLIALIITIIVMLILVGVTVSVSLNGGLFKTTKEATQKYGIEQLKEEVSLVLQTRNINDRIGNNQATLKEDLEAIEGVTVEQLKDDMYYVTRQDATLTVYDDGDMYKDKVALWDGQAIECPEIKEFNWYIYNCEQLKFFADFVNNDNTLTEEQKTIVAEAGYEESDITITGDTIVYLMADLDLGARQTNGTLTSGTAWTPIGGTTKDLTFDGTFEGNNHVIKGVYVNIDGNVAGLFSNSNTIQNLTIKDSYIQSNGGSGGIVGAARGGNLFNCHNINTTVIANSYNAGGIVGQFGSNSIDYEMIIKDCSNSGKVVTEKKEDSGNSLAGGIVGNLTAQNAKVENCSNTGEIYATGFSIGGIAGYADSYCKIDNCKNYGNVTGYSNTGGIAGSANAVISITDCYNSGTVKGSYSRTGGIIGFVFDSDVLSAYNSLVSMCVNTGLIEGYANVGGIAGAVTHYRSVIEKSYNAGRVTGTFECAGGIAGSIAHSSIIRNCYNLQETSGNTHVGGILGYSNEMTYDDGSRYEGENNQIINSYSIQRITGNKWVGGIIGLNALYSCSITNSYYLEGTATLDNGNDITTNALMKNAEYIKTTFLTTANQEEEIWEIREGENEGYPVIKGLK